MRKKLFMPEHIEFLEKNTSGKTFAELTIFFNEHFKTDFTARQIKCVCLHNKIKNGMNPGKCGSIKGYTPEIIDFMRELYQDVSLYDLLYMVNLRFGTAFTRNQIQHVTYYYGLRKEHGKSDPKPLGSEISIIRGNRLTVKVKVSMTGSSYNQMWKDKHRWVWEQANGKIPKGMHIVFLDHNYRNYAIENLAIVSTAELLKMSQFNLYSSDPEITKTGIAIVRHLLTIHNRIREGKI